MQKDLAARLASLEAEGLRRVLSRIDSPQGPRVMRGGLSLANFSSNDYLGLANEPFMAEAATRALAQYGTGAGSSRLISGTLLPHFELEDALAQWKGTEAALSFSCGYAAAVGTISAMVEKGDIVLLDKLSHACLIDGARLSGALIRVFPHNDLPRLESHLLWAQKTHPGKRVLIVTESVFSMDGDRAALAEIVTLKERFGAWLLLDEAHAAGVLGPHGRGLAAEYGLGAQIEIHMGTLSKALGTAGGYICGSKKLTDWLLNKARSFMFSTAPPPAIAAAATAAVRWMSTHAAQQRRETLTSKMSLLGKALHLRAGPESAIVPFMTGSNSEALRMSKALEVLGFWVPAIRYPTVPRGKARLRITLNAMHSDQAIEALADAILGSSHVPTGQA